MALVVIAALLVSGAASALAGDSTISKEIEAMKKDVEIQKVRIDSLEGKFEVLQKELSDFIGVGEKLTMKLQEDIPAMQREIAELKSRLTNSSCL